MKRVAREEQGSVLIVMGLTLPVLLLFTMVAMEIGSWYVHKRSLQNRADAAAFAAGASYATRFPACAAPSGGALEGEIVDEANRFAGKDTGDYNVGVSEQSRVSVSINGGADNPCDLQAGDDVSPDGGYWTDVKVKETDVAGPVSGLFGVAAPDIAATARVQLMDAGTVSGLRPMGLADTSGLSCPNAIVGLGINNSNPQTVALTQDPDDPNHWTGQLTSGSMPSDGDDVPVTLDCGPTDYMIGRITSLATANPRISVATVNPVSGCANGNTNAYWIPYDGPPCNVSLGVTLSGANTNANVQATVNGVNAPMQEIGNSNVWVLSAASLPIAPLTNDDVPVTFTVSGPGADPEPRTLHVLAGDDTAQGPIATASLSVHAKVRGTSFTAGAPLVIDIVRRTVAPGSQRVISQGVDCYSDNGNIQQQFTNSCTLPFQLNTRSGVCAPALPVRDCVDDLNAANPLEPLRDDYDDLWGEGANCTPMNWTASQANIEDGDPRVILVFLTGPLTTAWPIRGFTAFYVTGWDRQGPGASTCPGNEPYPRAGTPSHGEVWGRVLGTYVLPSSAAGPGSTPCTTEDSVCVATLVR